MKIGSYELQVPFVTSSADSIKDVKNFVQYKKGILAADLGSGDGKVVIALASQGLIVHGYEIKEELVRKAKENTSHAGLQDQVTFFHKSFWEVSLSPYKLIYVYGMTTIMATLEKKLQEELTPETLIISNIFTFPRWKHKQTIHNLHIYLKR